MTKLMHLADLHLGRKYENHDLLPDQKQALEEIVRMLHAERPDALMISGDVYDRSVPPSEAVTALDDFLNRAGAVCPVLMISGNHDSGERLSFAADFLRRQNLYVCGGFDGTLNPVEIGEANIYMLAYAHPANVGAVLRERGAEVKTATMEQAVRAALETRRPGRGRFNVLMAHLFAVSGGSDTLTTDSELASVGTLEQVDVSAFEGFDYVALGHLHRPQAVGRETVRYAGTPLPYSFSEDHPKSVAVVEWEAGQTRVRQLPLHAGHRMRTVTGLLEELTAPGYDAGNPEDYIQVRLLDKTLQVDARSRLHQVFPLLIGGIQYPCYEGASVTGAMSGGQVKNDEELLREFWRYKKHEEIPADYRKLLLKLLEEEA